MDDVAPQGANIQAGMLELVCEVLDAAVFVTDKFDCLTFASKRLLKYFPVPESRLQSGTRVRDLFGAIYDAGIKVGPQGEDPMAGKTREEWIAERISLNWRERHDAVLQIGRERWVHIMSRRTAHAVGITAIIDISDQKKREIQWKADSERVKLTEDILDNLPVPVFVQDANLHFAAVNKAFCRLQGTTADMLLGRSIFDLFAPDLAADYEEAGRVQLLTGQGHDALLHTRRPTGEDLTLVTTSARIGRPGRYYLANVFCDVSAHANQLASGPDNDWMDGNPFAAGLGPFQPIPDFDDANDIELDDPFADLAEAGIEPVDLADDSPLFQSMTGFDGDHPDMTEPVVFEAPDDEDDPIELEPVGPVQAVERRHVVLMSSDTEEGGLLVLRLKARGHDACQVTKPRELQAFLPAAIDAGLSIDMILIDGPGTIEWDEQDLKAACRQAGDLGIVCQMLPLLVDGHVAEAELDDLLNGEKPAWRPEFFPGRAPILADAPPLAPVWPETDYPGSLPPAFEQAVEAGLRSAQDAVEVLVVEDNVINRCVFEQVLESLGIRHRIVSDATSALRAIAERRPSIALIDLTLPDMDGLELARRIRAEEADRPPMPMIAVISRRDDLAENRAMAAGMNGILIKPISPDAVDILVRNHVLGVAPARTMVA